MLAGHLVIPPFLKLKKPEAALWKRRRQQSFRVTHSFAFFTKNVYQCECFRIFWLITVRTRKAKGRWLLDCVKEVRGQPPPPGFFKLSSLETFKINLVLMTSSQCLLMVWLANSDITCTIGKKCTFVYAFIEKLVFGTYCFTTAVIVMMLLMQSQPHTIKY